MGVQYLFMGDGWWCISSSCGFWTRIWCWSLPTRYSSLKIICVVENTTIHITRKRDVACNINKHFVYLFQRFKILLQFFSFRMNIQILSKLSKCCLIICPSSLISCNNKMMYWFIRCGDFLYIYFKYSKFTTSIFGPVKLRWTSKYDWNYVKVV